MDPVSQFKFACPVCGQHLQARAEEAGQTTECPSCFKKLTVPQAPTNAGGKLIITAALAETRRGPGFRNPEPRPQSVQPAPSKGPTIYIVLAFLATAVAVGGLLYVKDRGQEVSSGPQLWTDNVDELKLLDAPAVGRLNGWDFSLTTALWRDTRLILRQNGGQPEALRLQLTFPLRGGELVPGKTFRLGPGDAPFDTPIRINWKNEEGTDQNETVSSGYSLWIEFDEVSKTAVGGRIHICLPDVAKSWMAGRFSAANKTRIK